MQIIGPILPIDTIAEGKTMAQKFVVSKKMALGILMAMI